MPTRKCNTLTSAQAYQLRKWLDADRAKAATTPANALAADATTILSFPITADNVRKARIDLGITPSGYTGAHATTITRSRTRNLASAVKYLFEEMGMLVPADIAEMAK